MTSLAMPVQALPPAVLSRIKLELHSHLSARGNKTNGASIGGVIAKALQNFPNSTFSVRQYGGMLTFVECFLSDSLKYIGPGAGGDPIFEGILSTKDEVGLWHALTHPRADKSIVLDQQFNLHLLPTTAEIPAGWACIAPVSLQSQYDWAKEFADTKISEVAQKQAAINLLSETKPDNFTFAWVGFLKRQPSPALRASWTKFRSENIGAYFSQQLDAQGCPAEKTELYTAQLQVPQASPRSTIPVSGVSSSVNRPALLNTSKNINQGVSSTDLLKNLAHAYIDLAGETELRDLKINLGTIVDALSRLGLNNN